MQIDFRLSSTGMNRSNENKRIQAQNSLNK